MDTMRTTAGVLGALAAVALVLVQFMPWGGVAGSAFGTTFKADAYTWHMEASGSSPFGSGSDKTNWYDDEVDDDEDTAGDVTNIRIAIPLILAGLLAVALGGILAFVTRGGAAGAVLLVGGILAAIGTTLFALGVDGLFDSDQDWAASFYLAIAASALGLVAGVLGLAGGRAA